MTSPESVGQVSVEIVAEARALARSMRAEVEKAFRGLDVQDDIDRAVGRAQVRVPVAADVDAAGLAARLRAAVAAASTRARAAVEVDVDVDRQGGLARLGSMLRGIGGTGGGVGGLSSLFEGLSGAISRSAGQAAQLGGSLSGALTTATGPVGTIIGLLTIAGGAMAALAAAAVAAVPAITAVAGAAAAIPGALAGAGAAFGALSLGFKGISEAFKPSSGGGGGGGGAVNQARQIAAAGRQVEAARRGIAAANRQVEASERALAAAHRGVEAAEQRLVDAQKRALAAQAAISRAREQAVEDIEELNRSLRGAQLSEEDAALAVEDALRALNEAKLGGNIPEIQRADLAYRQSLQTLEEAQDTTADLAKETDEANRKGVEGSEKVQDAYRDQEEALQGVKDAQIGIIEANDSLKSAQDGVAAAMDGVRSAADGLTSAQEALAAAQQKVAAGGGGAAKEIIKLAPAAQKFVDAIKRLKPAFEDLRLDVQQRLFQGLDRTVTNLGQAWIPRLKQTLGAYASTFNGFFKDLGASLSNTEFMTDLQIGAEGFRQGMDAIFNAVTDKLIPALGDLAEASAPFLKALGEEIAGVVTQFSNWIAEGERTGGLTDFFDRAAQALREIFAIGRTVGSIIGSIFEIITGSQTTQPGESPLEAFRRGLERVAAWLDDPGNQQRIRDGITAIGDAVENVGAAITTVNGWVDRISGWADQFGTFRGDVTDIFDGVLDVFRQFPGQATAFVASLPGRIGQIFTTMGNRASYAVGFGLGVVSRYFAELPGRILGFIRSLPDRVSVVWNRVVEIARSLPGRVSAGVQALSQLPARIAGWLGGLGGRLTAVGADAIRGLWNGITSMGNWLRDRVFSFANNVIAGFRAGFDIGSPSKLMASEVGVWLPRGIGAGIDKGKPGLLRDVAAIADEVAAAALPALSDATFGLSADADAAISRNLSVADSQRILLGWKTGSSGSRLLDEIARIIDLEYQGNVNAALTRTAR